jgi:endonuclease YncB( thermonuclease family)
MIMEDFRELLLVSRKEQRSVQIYVNGQTIAMVVTGVGLAFVEGKNREYSKVPVRLDKIDAIAKS